MSLALKAEALIAAKHRGIASASVAFSDRLEWIERDGEPVLRKAAVDRTGRVTIYLDALRSRIDDDEETQREVEVILDQAAVVLGREWDESEHPRDDGGKFTFSGGDGGGTGSAGVEFVSPNVESHLDFHQAVAALKGDQQRALREVSNYIDQQLGEESKSHDIVGSWGDTAENSVAIVHQNSNWESSGSGPR